MNNMQPPGNPQGDPEFFAWIYLIALAGWGGLISHLQRIRDRKIVARLLLVDIGMAILAGLVSAYACLALGFSQWTLYAVVAVSGHLGVQAVDVFEQIMITWLRHAGNLKD